MKIILGSASKGRKEMLQEMGYEFEVMVSNIDEKAIRFDDPYQLTLALAFAKADALVPQILEHAILITADQVVGWNGKIREKPESEEQARDYLRTYHLAPAETVNGIAVTNTATGKRLSQNEASKVFFKPIPEEVIDEFLKETNVFKHAGAFSITSPVLQPYIAHIEGTIDSVIGLPKDLVRRFIGELE